jgi:hypothetical protein
MTAQASRDPPDQHPALQTLPRVLLARPVKQARLVFGQHPSSVDSGTECNSQTLSEKRTPGQPKVTIGPLGWIITYEDGEKPKSWWRRHKEPKKPKQTHNQTKPIRGATEKMGKAGY